MACINFTVYEAHEGWFVNGMHPIGPFYSRIQAMELAEGMVAAVRATGEDATLVVEEARSWATSPMQESLRRVPARGDPVSFPSKFGRSSPESS